MPKTLRQNHKTRKLVRLQNHCPSLAILLNFNVLCKRQKVLGAIWEYLTWFDSVTELLEREFYACYAWLLKWVLIFLNWQGVMKIRKRVTLMVITVSVIFAVCWLADSTSYFLGYYTPTHTFGDVTYATTSTMIMFNSAINPIVYALVNQRYREKIKGMMCCGCACRPSNRIYAASESQRMEASNSTTHPTQTSRECSKEWSGFHG